MKGSSTTLIKNNQEGRILSKTKTYSPPLSKEEIADVKKARKSKGKLYNSPEELIEDLHRNVAGSKKKSV